MNMLSRLQFMAANFVEEGEAAVFRRQFHRFSLCRVDSKMLQELFDLTLYGHIKTAEQRTIIHQYGDWYTGC